MNKILCDYCKTSATLVKGIEIYPHRKDLYNKKFWLCKTCGAYVGAYKDGTPLGRLANLELRIEKRKTHKIFDLLWQKGTYSRNEAYKWLSDKLGITEVQCHIGLFDLDMCKKVISICVKRGTN